MTAYELIRKLAPYKLLVEHMSSQTLPCTCTVTSTCTNCLLTELYDDLTEILEDADKYVH